MKSILRIFLILCLSIYTASCVSFDMYIRQFEKLENTDVCCGSMLEFEYRSFKKMVSGRKYFTYRDDVFIFDKEKSYFKAYEINSGNVGDGIVKVLHAETQPSDPSFFHPVFMFLDNNKTEISKVAVNYKWGKDFWGNNILEADINMPEKARFVVIYSKAFATSSITYSGVGLLIGPGGMPLDSYNSSQKLVNRSTGDVKIRVQ